ncbi:hypothetical protein [Rhodococcus koreensis]|uniref:hypothetical protein n=1 Tax=Rhodococcus koreensis TaxID=99653 RepID=UPI00366C83F0
MTRAQGLLDGEASTCRARSPTAETGLRPTRRGEDRPAGTDLPQTIGSTPRGWSTGVVRRSNGSVRPTTGSDAFSGSEPIRPVAAGGRARL